MVGYWALNVKAHSQHLKAASPLKRCVAWFGWELHVHLEDDGQSGILPLSEKFS